MVFVTLNNGKCSFRGRKCQNRKFHRKKTQPNSEVWNFVENDDASGKSRCVFCKKLLVKSAAKLKCHMINACSNVQKILKSKLMAEINKWLHKQSTKRAVGVKKSDTGTDMSISVSDLKSENETATASVASPTALSPISASPSTQTSMKSYLDGVTSPSLKSWTCW